ncbi:hypothetical protein Goshw_017309 [Gossypium schwendimanii]|uniref:Uncharacterized protein n=1 Tax=Gossypium schwendimanii TaxID=34291 RepID=A0A7J9NBV5_GOSSC|nr:hypothetical protein [Gossypium schwendimanii]
MTMETQFAELKINEEEEEILQFDFEPRTELELGGANLRFRREKVTISVFSCYGHGEGVKGVPVDI